MPCNRSETAAFLDFVDRYLAAASFVPEDGHSLFPLNQLLGQACELAIKGFLASTAGKWPKLHDLEQLTSGACDCGLDLDEGDLQTINLLNNIYFESKTYNRQFPSRYPMVRGGVWVTPSKAQSTALIEKIASQARDRLTWACRTPTDKD